MRLAAPLLLLRWWARGAAEAGYRLHMEERLGLYGAPTESGRLWLHAVSLGETLAGLQEMLVYGLKGMAAYTHHAGRCQVLMLDAQPPSWMQCL